MDYDGSAQSAIYIALLWLHAALRLCRVVGCIIAPAVGCARLHAVCYMPKLMRLVCDGGCDEQSSQTKMLAKRIIPCLDVRDGLVVKGVQFKNHEVVGSIIDLAKRYADEGADELVFYDITASAHGKKVDKSWVARIAEVINIPFAVAGGIRTVEAAQEVLEYGADKISINSPALSDPSLITRLADRFGVQCVVVGIDSYYDSESGEYLVKQFTGDEKTITTTSWKTLDWVKEVQKRGAGEIVLNMMNQDGMKNGYDLKQLKAVQEVCNVPLIASGGAGSMEHFYDAFNEADVSGALAASVFHKSIINIGELKAYLNDKGVLCRG